MTKAELIKMIENLDDNTELRFVAQTHDRDGWLEDYPVDIKRVEEQKHN